MTLLPPPVSPLDYTTTVGTCIVVNTRHRYRREGITSRVKVRGYAGIQFTLGHIEGLLY